jgi:hypothetical protein
MLSKKITLDNGAHFDARGSSMRILHVIPSIDPDTGGPAEGLKQYCNIYRLGGHEVEVASLDAPESIEKLCFPRQGHRARAKCRNLRLRAPRCSLAKGECFPL